MAAGRTLFATWAMAVTSSAAFTAPLTGPLTFVGITPCRILDTRGGTFTGQAGPPSLVANATREFQMTGDVPGVPTQCGIPSTAVAISVNFTVTNFAGQGNLRVFPAGSALPVTSILNYQLQTIANATSMTLGPVGSEKGIGVYAAVNGTDFLADVNGYYLPAGTLASGQTLKGDFAFAGQATASGVVLYAQIAFSLASAPAAPPANFIMPGGGFTASCPGTPLDPQAAPGQLCAYANTCSNMGTPYFASPAQVAASTADPFGAILVGVSTAAGQMFCYGSWAVTAP
jgi:hypothetical protein